ncbi:hypothetical protein HOLleu_31273 [Holothuria leucospilota]|uniref:Uncharacterized protein n=1 Tax=Holothuria leucospilota TaxID=206669 RepID=A0A9Q0YPX6_HOLLE|nr:hypothetical protein HOLleu_31273 [Holothuria leucospilota]
MVACRLYLRFTFYFQSCKAKIGCTDHITPKKYVGLGNDENKPSSPLNPVISRMSVLSTQGDNISQ